MFTTIKNMTRKSDKNDFFRYYRFMESEFKKYQEFSSEENKKAIYCVFSLFLRKTIKTRYSNRKAFQYICNKAISLNIDCQKLIIRH